MKPPIYLGTVCLEKNRWSTKLPSIQASAWATKARDAGFEGIELWENHALKADAGEVVALERSGVPIPIFNSYAPLDAAGAEARKAASTTAARLHASFIKFNFGADTARREEYLASLAQWVGELPSEIRLLCECHKGTLAETPSAALALLSSFNPERVSIIVHMGEADEMEPWFAMLAPRITHLHVQMAAQPKGRILLRKTGARLAASLSVLKAFAYRGSFTIEFTEGVAEPGETPEMLFENACDDLRTLRSALGAQGF